MSSPTDFTPVEMTPFQAVTYYFDQACDRLGVGLGDDQTRIVEVAEHLAAFLLRSHLSDLLGLHAGPMALVTELSERPTACAFARLQARNGNLVTNRRHIPVSLSDASCWVLRHLDGSRDRASLLKEMDEAVAVGALAKLEDEVGATLDVCLARLARAGLLVD